MSSGFHTHLHSLVHNPYPHTNKTVLIVIMTVSKGTDFHFLIIDNSVLAFLVDCLANAIRIFTSL